MTKYYFDNETFIIEDFQNAKTFSSFFPAVSGLDGKPLWAFYCNRGQCLSSFGVQSKNTPIIPFDTAFSAYQNISLKSFRTFIKANGKFYEPFSNLKNKKTKMKIDRAKLTIIENLKNFNIEVLYSTVPHENFSALIRKVKITNTSNNLINFDLIDGLPIILPHGFSNYEYKELATLMSSYCVVENLKSKMPFIKFNTSNNDLGKFDSLEKFNESLSKINIDKVNNYINKNDELINNLLSPMEVSSNNKLFDQYAKQSLLDNNLRGGFPIKISENVPYYVYGRKHGDMERDYNNFQINNSYYSCGEGHFRDVNQNRRSDIYLYPFVKNYNIKLFFNLLQIDEHNPLNVKPSTFKIKDNISNKNDYFKIKQTNLYDQKLKIYKTC